MRSISFMLSGCMIQIILFRNEVMKSEYAQSPRRVIVQIKILAKVELKAGIYRIERSRLPIIQDGVGRSRGLLRRKLNVFEAFQPCIS